jgi:hypothetical protein
VVGRVRVWVAKVSLLQGGPHAPPWAVGARDRGEAFPRSCFDAIQKTRSSRLLFQPGDQGGPDHDIQAARRPSAGGIGLTTSASRSQQCGEQPVGFRRGRMSAMYVAYVARQPGRKACPGCQGAGESAERIGREFRVRLRPVQKTQIASVLFQPDPDVSEGERRPGRS